MVKESVLELRGKSHRRLGGKKLRRNRTEQSYEAKRHQYKTHFQNIGDIRVTDTPVDNGRHHERHKKLEGGLQHLKERRKNRLLLIIL